MEEGGTGGAREKYQGSHAAIELALDKEKIC